MEKLLVKIINLILAFSIVFESSSDPFREEYRSYQRQGIAGFLITCTLVIAMLAFVIMSNAALSHVSDFVQPIILGVTQCLVLFLGIAILVVSGFMAVTLYRFWRFVGFWSN